MRMTARPLVVVVSIALLAAPGGGCESAAWRANADSGAAAARPAGASPRRAAKPAAPESTLYDRLGGEKTIAAIVDEFVARAAADRAVNFARAGTARAWDATPQNVARLKARLVEFLGTATGGPQKYHGQDMVTAHKGMEITAAQFDAAAADFRAALEKLRIPAPEQEDLLDLVAATRDAIVERPK
jgi:hemoglobin